MKLLIVESPAKCQKIQGFLGSGWRVQATMGHIRALKEDLEAIGFRNDWEPTYENIASKAKAIASLRQAAKGAEVFLGSDDDREGESIAYHTCILLGLDPATTPRVVFHEITEKALREAVAAPRRIDMSKFHAQQSRTMLDLLIGFTLSPCLWRGIGFMKGLSAGRCQTPALRIIYDRDREIEGHQAKHSWRITVASDHDILWKGLTEYADEVAASAVLQTLTGPNKNLLRITDRTERISTHNPPKPFITSSLQQEASSRCGMNPKITMKTAQTLYEAGHITYMRTDNAILSQEAIEAASAVVKERWGEEYLGGVSAVENTETPAKKKVVKKKTATTTEPKKPEAQAAHEGIRPTHMEVTTLEGVTAQEQRLYDLIWKRTIQSVMAAELRDVVKLSGQTNNLPLQTEWDQTRFAGWRILDTERKEDEEAAAAALFETRKTLQKDQEIKWKTVAATEHRTSPPARYTEASLIKELESRGIGRPSTYATLVDTVMDRAYVEKTKIEAQTITLRALEVKANAKEVKTLERKEKVGAEKDKLRTTPLGRTVIEWLLQKFGDMVDYSFTASMEAQLDEVAKGDRVWKTVLTETWDRYKDRYDEVMAQAKQATAAPPPVAGSDGVIRTAKSANFGDGYKMVVSAKKGPLFVLEREGEQTKFATVPANLSIQTAMKEDVIRAFEAAAAPINTTGETLGELEDDPVIRKKGKFGLYVTWRTYTLNCTAEDTLESLKPKLLEKVSGNAVDHQVGPYKIKRGPYGLYMFKPTVGAKATPKFVGIPEDTPWATLTPESAEQLYKHCLEAKKEKGKFKPSHK